MIERGRPRGKRMRVPFTSAPAFFHSSSASGVVAELDADFLQDGVGVVLDDLQALLVQHLHQRNLAHDVGKLHDLRPGAGGAARIGTAAGAAAAGGCDRRRNFWRCVAHIRFRLID